MVTRYTLHGDYSEIIGDRPQIVVIDRILSISVGSTGVYILLKGLARNAHYRM